MRTSLRFFITSLEGGGAERVLIDLINQLNLVDYEITLMTISGGILKKELRKDINYHQIVQIENKFLKNIISKILWKIPAFLFAFFWVKGSYDFEIAYLEGLPTKVIAKKQTTGKKIAFVHCDVSVNDVLMSLYRSKKICIEQYRSFEHVCFVSDKCMQGFEKSVGKIDNARVVHNVINSDKIKQLAREKCKEKYEEKVTKIISVGRLAPEKNYVLLLSVIEKISFDHKVELWIVGEGEERKHIEREIEKRKLQNVRLLGFKNNPYPYIKQADIFICTSKYEGYSTAVVEAITLGIPVLTTDCAGMEEILEKNKYGKIVNNSEEALYEELKKFIHSNESWENIKSNLKEYNYEGVQKSLEEFKKILL